MNKYYISFGQSHEHIIDKRVFNKDCICVIEEDNYEKARERAFKLFGNKFCMVYTEASQPDMKWFPRGLIKL